MVVFDIEGKVFLVLQSFHQYFSAMESSVCVCFFFFVRFWTGPLLQLGIPDKKSIKANSVDPDETAHYQPSHIDLRCLHKYLIWFTRRKRLIIS